MKKIMAKNLVYLAGWLFLICFTVLLWPQGGEAQAAMVRSERDWYDIDEPIVVHYSGMPGNYQDWVTVAEISAPPDVYGQRFFTEGRRQGTCVFQGLPPGRYEVRVYFDWPRGGFYIRARDYFDVGLYRGRVSPPGPRPGPPVGPPPGPRPGPRPGPPPGPRGMVLHADQEYYRPFEPIGITFYGLPPARHATITVVPSGSPPQSFGQVYNTHGRYEGHFVFKGLPPGYYEVRIHFDTNQGGFNYRTTDSLTVGR